MGCVLAARVRLPFNALARQCVFVARLYRITEWFQTAVDINITAFEGVTTHYAEMRHIQTRHA